jgi:hypothetical protein
MYIILEKAKEIQRDERGMAWTWRGTGEQVATFTDANKFMTYVKEHAAELGDVVAFTGSASLLQQANLIIADQLKKAGVL